MAGAKKKSGGNKILRNQTRDWLDENSISLYFKEIGNYPKLSSEEEARCARAYREGNERALEKLVLSNLRFVVSIAKKYQHLGVSLSDLINEGNIGLIRAARKFDEARGVRFITYAVWWIKQAIFQYLSEQGRIVRIPLNWSNTIYKMQKVQNSLSQELGRDPTNQEISEEIAMDLEEVNRMMPHCQPHYSLESSSTNQDDVMLMNSLADEDAPNPMDGMFNYDLKRLVKGMLDGMQEREARILKYYYGLDDSEPMTLEEIGEIFGVTRERIRQIKEKALKNLMQSYNEDAVASMMN